MQELKKDIIGRLQKDILLWQGYTPPQAGKAKGIGLGPLESAFPNGVFPTGAVHEMLCFSPEQSAATSGLLAGLIVDQPVEKTFPGGFSCFQCRARQGNIHRPATRTGCTLGHRGGLEMQGPGGRDSRGG